MIPAENRKDLGILVLRVLGPGTLFFAHGLGKLTSMPGIFQTFPNPIGLGSVLSAALTILAEGVCAVAVMAGLWTRINVLPILGVMFVAVVFHHAGDPFHVKEKGILYFIIHLTLFFTGGGRYVLSRKFLAAKN